MPILTPLLPILAFAASNAPAPSHDLHARFEADLVHLDAPLAQGDRKSVV